MFVLIVQSNFDLASIWMRHLERSGATVKIAQTQEDAVDMIAQEQFDVIVLDVVLASGSALSVADFAYFRSPSARVVFVTDTTFFSDGSIFQHSANACAFVRLTTPPQDLAVIVQHYGQAANRDHAIKQSTGDAVPPNRVEGSKG